MNLTQIESALQRMFDGPLQDGERRKIVFWADEDREFVDDVDNISLDGIKVEKLTENNPFYMKHLIEKEDPTSSYLIYTHSELLSEDNWLLDMALYAKIFYADRVSLILDEYNIDPALRGTIKTYQKFFNNEERRQRFQQFAIDTYTVETIEIAMMSALCQVKSPNFEAVLRTVLMDSLDDENNKYLSQIERFFDIEVFWSYVQKQYGYEREVKTLKTLFIHLVITALNHTIDEKYLVQVEDFIALHNKANAIVFIDHWMHHKVDYDVYDQYAAWAEQEIQMADILQAIPVDEFKLAEIFPVIDRMIINYIVNSLKEKLEDYEDYIKLIKLRRAKHFYHKFAPVYEALYYTVKMHEFHKAHKQGLPLGRAIDLYEAYTEQFYVMDTYYRKFYIAFDQAGEHNVLRQLSELVEYLYTHWFMGELSSGWQQALKSELANDWSLPGVPNQRSFYSSYISPHIEDDERVFVIISDAMRYEVGVELAERLKRESVGTCDMQTMLGVVPSVTKLGMAALLPHRELHIDEQGRVLANGKDTAGLAHRQQIIAARVEESIAIHFQDLLMKNQAARREMVKDKKLIYIYHDTIDAMGDNAATEVRTFQAVETALDELNELVRIIRNDLSGTHVYMTTDHGFIYQRMALQESDKIAREELEALEVKRRYMLSQEKRELTGQVAINLSSIIANKQQLTAYVPNGTLRNRMQGTGVNFVHGGASLQEIVLPLIAVRIKRSGQKGVVKVEKVDVKLTTANRRVTNSIFSLDFFQTEKVGGKYVPRTVLVYFADETGHVLSNEETLIGDRADGDPADRTFKIHFVLKSMTYDRAKTYYLIIKDLETEAITERIPFTISLGIASDFDFS